ncbi:MAG: sodium:solute symporter family protein [Bacteriovoracia bacterium]
MELSWPDYLIIAVYLVFTLMIGFSLKKRAEGDISGFFLGNRSLPWWLVGTSMVATTFAADTPLAVTELVAQAGISGNWLWWNMLAGGMLTTFFFARYWRRAEVLTDLEFIELRYSGKGASFLRGFRSLYFGVFMNALVIGWVNLALMSLLKVFFDIPDHLLIWVVSLCILMVVLYASLSGLLGVVFTDFFQFIIAISGCIILAVLVVNSEKIGGIDGLKSQLPAWSLTFFPTIGEASTSETATALSLGLGSFLTFATMQWWASWYPGNEPGGGGYIAQRMMSAKNERHALGATLYFQIAHYCIRPWPWILVALAALVLYPQLPADDKKLGFVMAMRDYLPTGLKGLLLVAFFSAYMSTISTQLNWGTSYLINDFYARFIVKDASQKQLVWASRLGTLLLMIIGLLVTTQIQTISGVWQFLIKCGAGLGLVLILRWYWWRINAWSEIAASIAPFIAYLFTKFYLSQYVDPAWGKGITQDPRSFFFIVSFTTLAWIIVTYLTKPTEDLKLREFYKRIKPLGIWLENKNTGRNTKLISLAICWLSAIVAAYSVLFASGYLIFKEWSDFGIWLLVFLASLSLMLWLSNRVEIFKEAQE